MNSYFASVEQQDTGLVGPLAVVPMANVETTCVIAASVEAKAYGINTGTSVRDAKKLCPKILLVEARHKLYVEYHQRIVTAVESCLHVDQICSIDEMYGQLMGTECNPDRAAAIAYQVKAAIRAAVGPRIRCSIGLAPNAWLAKLASDMQKPDGMTMILPEQMPEAIYRLKLTDLPGIASAMAKRLAGCGIFHVHQLCALTEQELIAAWGSKVLGSIWWAQLRGQDMPYRSTRRSTVGHSHVLPPESRTDPRARAVLSRMIHKAAARMRQLGYSAGRMTVYVEHLGGGGRWEKRFPLVHCRDTPTMLDTLAGAWATRPPHVPLKVGVVLSELEMDGSVEGPMYPSHAKRNTLADAMDKINQRFGRDALYPGAMVGEKESAPTRIAFNQVPGLDQF